MQRYEPATLSTAVPAATTELSDCMEAILFILLFFCSLFHDYHAGQQQQIIFGEKSGKETGTKVQEQKKNLIISNSYRNRKQKRKKKHTRMVNGRRKIRKHHETSPPIAVNATTGIGYLVFSPRDIPYRVQYTNSIYICGKG